MDIKLTSTMRICLMTAYLYSYVRCVVSMEESVAVAADASNAICRCSCLRSEESLSSLQC